MEALKKRLVRFYKVYKPSQIPRVSEIAAKYLDRSEELIEALQVSDDYVRVCVFFSSRNSTQPRQKKYGPEPKEEDQEEEKNTTTTTTASKNPDTRLAALQTRLVRFYKKYNPKQVERAEDIAIKYRDREEDLFKALIDK